MLRSKEKAWSQVAVQKVGAYFQKRGIKPNFKKPFGQAVSEAGRINHALSGFTTTPGFGKNLGKHDDNLFKGYVSPYAVPKKDVSVKKKVKHHRRNYAVRYVTRPRRRIRYVYR